MPLTKRNQLAVKVEQLAVLFVGVPLHTLAAAWIGISIQADLIAVIDAGCAHVRKLEQGGQSHQPLVIPAQCQQARCVVAIQQIEGNLGCLLWIAGQLSSDGESKALSISHFFDEKIIYRVGERIIHRCIELIPLKPFR
ncbi:hypothetical protein D3C74_231040 [compost metagenome]